MLYIICLHMKRVENLSAHETGWKPFPSFNYCVFYVLVHGVLGPADCKLACLYSIRKNTQATRKQVYVVHGKVLKVKKEVEQRSRICKLWGLNSSLHFIVSYKSERT